MGDVIADEDEVFDGTVQGTYAVRLRSGLAPPAEYVARIRQGTIPRGPESISAPTLSTGSSV